MVYLQRLVFDTSNFQPYVLQYLSRKFDVTMFVDDLIRFGLLGQLKDITVLALDTGFEVTNIGQLYWFLGIQVSLNRDSITLSWEAGEHKILKWFQMTDSHPTLLLITPNT
jgi:hypothetical protein